LPEHPANRSPWRIRAWGRTSTGWMASNSCPNPWAKASQFPKSSCPTTPPCSESPCTFARASRSNRGGRLESDYPKTPQRLLVAGQRPNRVGTHLGAVPNQPPSGTSRKLPSLVSTLSVRKVGFLAGLKTKTHTNVNVHAGFRVVPRCGLEPQTN